MTVTLFHTGRRPGQTQFGLDTFTETYKCNSPADQVLLADNVPQKGDAHPDYQFMFVTDRYFSETGESACVVDITYTGCMAGTESPTLPPQQNSVETPIQSASSSKASTGATTTSPCTIQFYAQSTVLNYISYLAPGSDVPPDPQNSPSVITWTINDTTFSIGNVISDLVDVFFTLQTTIVAQSQEIVAGKFWQNTSRKNLVYVPFIFDVPSGPLVTLASPGDGYTPADTLTCSSGGESATIVVDTVGGVFGGSGILDYHVTSTDFTVAHNLMPATGGTGTGAKFNVIIIP